MDDHEKDDARPTVAASDHEATRIPFSTPSRARTSERPPAPMAAGPSGASTAELIDAAIGYVARGWRVLPICFLIDGVCSCREGARCTRPAAHLMNESHLGEATTDPARIRAWWESFWPTANIGIVTGRASGLAVIRCDDRSVGPDMNALRDRLLLAGPAIVEVSATTTDLYFACSSTHIGLGVAAAGIQVFIDDDFVVAPPSRTTAGTVAWQVAPAGDLPELPWPVNNVVDFVSDLAEAESPVPAPASTAGSLDVVLEVVGVIDDPARDGENPSATWTPSRPAERSRPAPVDGPQVTCITIDGARPSSPSSYGVEHPPPALPDGPQVVCIADIEPETLEWLWPRRVPIGNVTILQGDPEHGKSTLLMNLAAGVTRGAAAPCSTDLLAEGDVLILTHEDAGPTELRPRLEAVGADLARVHLLEGFREKGELEDPVLPQHIGRMEQICLERGVRLVIIDPISDFIGGTNGKNEQEIRRILRPLVRMARRAKLAVIIVRHLVKNPRGSALNAGVGSVGYGAVARSVLGVEKSDGLILRSVKLNLERMPAPLRYEVVSVILPSGTRTSRVEWIGEAEVRPQAPAKKVEQAATLLKTLLAHGPIASAQVEERAAQEGISPRTLQAARSYLGVVAEKKNGAWVCRLPDEASKPGHQGLRLVAPLDEGRNTAAPLDAHDVAPLDEGRSTAAPLDAHDVAPLDEGRNAAAPIRTRELAPLDEDDEVDE